jgi:hypothetical protein
VSYGRVSFAPTGSSASLLLNLVAAALASRLLKSNGYAIVDQACKINNL